MSPSGFSGRSIVLLLGDTLTCPWCPFFSISTSLQARFAIQRENNYKKAGSSKAAFQIGCGTALFVPALGFAAWLVQELSTE